jgi:hypothetical protein
MLHKDKIHDYVKVYDAVKVVSEMGWSCSSDGEQEMCVEFG